MRRDAAPRVRASASLPRVAPERWPMALARLHRALPVGGVLDLTVGEGNGGAPAGDDDPDPRPGGWPAGALADVLVGAGFTVEEVATGPGAGRHARLVARAARARTLPDTVGPAMGLLVCGLNPSLQAADASVGFARPGNRFWPAALEAGLVLIDRSPDRALADHGVGMTDVVKRATTAAAELTAAEYRAGLARVERLVAWLRPRAVCFVGLAGWRAAVDRRATAGVQRRGLAGARVYVMPSTSGLNARTRLAELADHLRAARHLAGGGDAAGG